MVKYLKIRDEPYLVKDSESKAILNTDNAGLLGYKKRKQQMVKMKKMESDISEIKEILNRLLEQKEM